MIEIFADPSGGGQDARRFFDSPWMANRKTLLQTKL
jgi:hypothetical protein